MNLEPLRKIAEAFLAARRITCFQELIIFREFMTEILGPFAALSNGCQCTDHWSVTRLIVEVREQLLHESKNQDLV